MVTAIVIAADDDGLMPLLAIPLCGTFIGVTIETLLPHRRRSDSALLGGHVPRDLKRADAERGEQRAEFADVEDGGVGNLVMLGDAPENHVANLGDQFIPAHRVDVTAHVASVRCGGCDAGGSGGGRADRGEGDG